MRILVTRAADQARATADRLRAAGHAALVAPLSRIVFDPDVPLALDGVAALLVTSTNGVEALSGRADMAELLRRPMFVVGARTARAARELGFGAVISADGDRSDLVRRVASDLRPGVGRLLWLAGRDRTEIFATELRACGFAVDVAEVYRAEERTVFSSEITAALEHGKIDAIAVYSPRSAGLILAALGASGFSPASPRPSIHAISEAAARPFREAGHTDVRVAARPDEAALMETFDRPDSAPGAAS